MFEENPILVQGFVIPSNDPLFLTILTIHVVAGMTCVITGIMAMLSKKLSGFHTKSGTVYFWCLVVVFVTSTIMAIGRWQEDYHLFILGFIAFSAGLIGRRARKKMWQKWSIVHISGMGFSYIFLLIAFYVDNGKFLPVWRDFNPVIYWLLPLLIGVPIIIRTLLQHPLSRNYFKKNADSGHDVEEGL